MSSTQQVGQCRATGDGRGIITLQNIEPGAGPLWIEMASRSSYPADILQGLRDNGYFDEGETPDCYRIPLGIVNSVEQGDDSSPDVGITHIKPTRFANPEGTQLAPLRDGGRLYVFINGWLWREIAVIQGGSIFRDINLAKYQGQNQRPLDDLDTEVGAITLPYKMNGQPCLVQIAYSEVPWSWALIERLGGLADDDPRYLPDLPVHDDYRWHRDNVDHVQRMQRATQLNLLSFNDDLGPEQLRETHLLVAGTVEQHYNQPEPGCPSPIPDLDALDIEERLIVAALPDPLGIALDLVADIQLDLDELKQHLAAIEDDEHSENAVYAYQLFFNEKLHRERHGARGTRHVDRSEQSRKLRSAAARMDRAYIEQILHVEERRHLRQSIREKRKALARWLDGKNADGSDAAIPYAHFLSCQQALLDYAWLPLPGDRERSNPLWQAVENRTPGEATPDYLALWSAIVGIMGGGGGDPALYDSGYDADQDEELEKLDEDPINQWLAGLIEPTHPLHSALFPSNNQVSDEEEFELDMAQALEPPKGTEFRAHAFAALNGAQPDWWYNQAVAKQANEVLGAFLFHFQKQWQKSLSAQKIIEIPKLFVRLGKVSRSELKGARLVMAGDTIPQGYIVMDGDLRVREQLKRQQRRSSFRAESDFSALRGDRVAVMGKDGMIGSTLPSELYQNHGLPTDFSQQSWNQLFRSVDSNGMATASATLVVIPDTSPYARHWNLPEGQANTNVRLTTGVMRLGNVSLPPVLAVFEVMNLQATWREGASNGWNGNQLSKAAVIAIGLAYALTDTAIRLAGEPAAMRIMTTPMRQAFGRRVLSRAEALAYWGSRGSVELAHDFGLRTFQTLGAGLSAAGAVLAGWESQIQLHQGNYASAGAHAVEAGAAAGLALSQLGRAAAGEGAKRFMIMRLAVAFGPWGWAFLGLTITASLLAHSLRLSPLERWAAFGPFASRPRNRYSKEFENKDSRAAFHELLSLLQGPQVHLDRNDLYTPPRLEVTIISPSTGTSGLIEHNVRWYRRRGDDHFASLTPIAWENLLSDQSDPGSRIGQIAWYALPAGGECEALCRTWNSQTEDYLPIADPADADHAALQSILDYANENAIACQAEEQRLTSGWARSQKLRL